MELTVKQRKALSLLAQGYTLKEAARKTRYKSLEAVHRLAHSPSGVDYLRKLADEIDAETIYGTKARISDLRTIARVHLFCNPRAALEAVREANRLCKTS